MSLVWSQLNPEQRKVAIALHDKWEAVARSTERINKKAATEAINTAYFSRNTKTLLPEIVFFDSPYALREAIPKYENDEINEKGKRKTFSIERRFEIDLAIRPRTSARYQIEKLPNFDDTPDGFPDYGRRSMSQLALMYEISIQLRIDNRVDKDLSLGKNLRNEQMYRGVRR
jgi:hypothetical protein